MSNLEVMDKPARIRTNESGILATGEYGFPSGHLGHLSVSQIEALEDFKRIAAQAGVYKPASGGQIASHDDTTLL